MKTFEIRIKADTNDADYVTAINKLTQAQLHKKIVKRGSRVKVIHPMGVLLPKNKIFTVLANVTGYAWGDKEESGYILMDCYYTNEPNDNRILGAIWDRTRFKIVRY